MAVLLPANLLSFYGKGVRLELTIGGTSKAGLGHHVVFLA
jgi:hypothetical protein